MAACFCILIVIECLQYYAGSRPLRSEAKGSTMEKDSSATRIYPPTLDTDSPWISIAETNNASSPLGTELTEALSMSTAEYDTDSSMSAMEANVRNISRDRPRHCAFCKKRLNVTKYAIVHDESRRLFWHTNCYNHLVWKHKGRQARLKDNISEMIIRTPKVSTQTKSNQSKSNQTNQTKVNVPYGARIESSTHKPLCMHLCLLGMIMVPIAVILWMALCSIELDYCNKQ